MIYRENFFDIAGDVAAQLCWGWTGYYGNAQQPGATPVTPGSQGNPANAMLSGGPTGPTPGGKLSMREMPGVSTTSGFVPLLSVNGAMDFLVFTNEFTIDRSVNSPESFTWYAASGYTGDEQRLAIQIGSRWYASTSPMSPPGGVIQGTAFAAAAQQLVTDFSTNGSAWETINFACGSPLSLGPALGGPLPSGNITGFGIYAEIADNTGTNVDNSPITNERTFFDTFEVNAPVPEPGSLAIFGGSLLLMTRARRRK